MRDRRTSTVQLLVVALMSVSVGLVGVMTWRTAKGQSSPQTEAELWLSWSSDTKDWYVGGFLEGFMEGERAGCSLYADKMADKPYPIKKLPKLVCLENLPDFPEPTQVYVQAITRYYTKYPNDRQAGKARILLELASPPGLTIDQIHAKLTGNPRPE